LHRFTCHLKDRQPAAMLAGAHLLGADNVPLRGDLTWAGGELRCAPRTQDPVGVSLLWPVDGVGTLQLQTTRLPARERPYNLHVELARHQLMRLSVKREEWGLFDYNGMDDIAARIDQARDAFVRALQKQEAAPAEAARHADEALATGLQAGEEMSRFHAGVFLGRRHQSGGFARPFLGVSAPPTFADPSQLKRLAELAHFVRVPFVWRELQPGEHAQHYDGVDAAIRAAAAAGLAVRGGPLLNFGVSFVPDWMYIWENDFEAIYEAAREHVERTVRRHAKSVGSWIAASGMHADNVFSFTFEQIMELTRMSAATIKQVAPRSQVLVEISQPWGEYYARNPQTVPPLLYADMIVQSGVQFDAFGLQLLVGLGTDGFHCRDLLQVSALIDKLANLGRPIHITALGAPSATPGKGAGVAPGGEWRGPWTDENQAEWLAQACEISLSKPYVEAVCLQPLCDGPESIIPAGGLWRDNLSSKPAFERLVQLRAKLAAGPGK
jgi:hypothetical protein